MGVIVVNVLSTSRGAKIFP